jgi:N-acyl homoserine lactone hydrolase
VTSWTVSTLLRGFQMTCDQVNLAMCGVYLLEPDDGGPRVVFDTAHVGRRRLLQQSLEARGLSPDDIDLVVLSHAHWDHVQNVDLFGSARLLVHEDELSYARSPRGNDHATPPWTGMMLDASDAEPVSDGDEPAPGLRILHLPGHSPGSVALVTETAEGNAVLTGDAVGSAHSFLSRQCSGIFFDATLADASIARVADVANVVYPGHDRPFVVEEGSVRHLVDTVPIAFEVPDPVQTAADVSFVARDLSHRFVLPGLDHERKD